MAEYVGAIVAIVGAVVGAVGQHKAAEANKEAARKNEARENQNAILATRQGEMDAEQARKVSLLRIGAAEAAYGASGIRTEGSAIDVLESAAAESELNIQNIRFNAQMKAAGFLSNADLDRSSARAASTVGTYATVGTGLSGAAKGWSYYDLPKKSSGTGSTVRDYGSSNTPGSAPGFDD